jgi:hypothetical protein
MKNVRTPTVKSSFLAVLFSVLLVSTVVYSAGSNNNQQCARQHRFQDVIESGVEFRKTIGSTQQLFSSGAIQT